ncbi:MAG: hypothetical protein MMC33_005789 [Icmadophila ericetorum]|nr:hypothetical protein [Icmadophila ericetorum]
MAPNEGNLFSAQSLQKFMHESLPKSNNILNPYDAVALLTHACMLAVGFKLVGLGEEHRIGNNKPLSGCCHYIEADEPSTQEAHSDSDNTQPLPSEWNQTTTSDYAFRYSHPQSSLQYLIKISRLGTKAVVNGLGLGDDKVHTFNFPVQDFTSASSFPFSRTESTTDTESTDHSDSIRTLSKLFISTGRITDLASLFKVQIIQKLAPGIRKEGYEESPQTTTDTSSSSTAGQEALPPAPGRENPFPTQNPLRNDPLLPFPARPHPFNDPLAAGPPRRPFPAGDFPPPDFEDEYEINRPLRDVGAGRRPLNIGERDLYPPGLGPNDPLRGGVGPFGGGGGGGMYPTADEMFGRGGEGGYDPQAPPGARWDPVGPGGNPLGPRGGPRGGGFGPRGFGGGRGGGPPNPFGGFGGSDFI